jgi:DNA-binding beta-propeller fold protein YncE
MPPRSVQGEHQRGHQPFPDRIVGHELLELGHQYRSAAAVQLRLDPRFQRVQAPLLQLLRRGAGEWLVEHVGQRRAAPQRQPVRQHPRGALSVAGFGRLRGTRNKQVESGGIELTPLDRQHIPDAHHTTGCHQAPAQTTVGLTPEGVAVNQPTDTVYIADLRNGEGPGAVSVVNGATCNGTITTGCSTHPAPTAPAGFGTIGVAIDTTTDQIYATGIQDTSVSIINGATCNATHLTGCKLSPPKDAVGNFPAALAADHTNETVYVIDNRGTDLSLIRTARSCLAQGV